MVLREFFLFRKLVTNFHFSFRMEIFREGVSPKFLKTREITIYELKNLFDSKILEIEEKTNDALVELVENRYSLDDSKISLYEVGINNHLKALIEIVNEDFFEGERYSFIDYGTKLQPEVLTAINGNKEIMQFIIYPTS